ncbi:hypothetical protein GPA10_37890 [Streptomyces sp. p1417]|uniref:Uncharacterized protein n=1 Tax=Streptomyces typhae TaxID=2681492 RepID=A0A6L6XA79_9ACTN|nr:hypothetical protein [Streptomyces typhae]MVO90370.1 hypothetical protein [Streptomyces typhae]
MGSWVVIAGYRYGDVHSTEFLHRGLDTEEQALKALRSAVHTYVPSKRIIEKWRRVYRFAGQETYLVVIHGKVTEWECTLRIAELVSDSADPAVGERAQRDDGVVEAARTAPAAEVADGPQDRIPPGY